MGPYVFKESDAEDFARAQGITTRKKGGELFFTFCPYCNGGGKDKNTFSINLRTGKYHCFRSGCGISGNMITLAKDFNFSLGQNADEYYKPTRHYKVFKTPDKPIEPKDAAIEYLAGRGISEATARKYQVTAKDNLIVFPFIDEHGEIQTIKYRNPDPGEHQSKEFFEINCKPILFGMHQCNPENKTLIVTEGQMDSLSVAEAGLENAVSVPGGVSSFTWVPYCWNWVSQFDRIIIFGDHEKGKITLYADFLQRWKRKVWCVREEDYLECKDANEILMEYGAEQIRVCIENAVQPPIPQVIDLADVEDIDINTIQKLPTGIWELDDLLCGGLPFGQLILITGKAGDGKSTLANQIVVNAVEEEYKTFIYSGELPNYLLKSWMSFQAAGPDNVKAKRKKRPDQKSEEYEIAVDAQKAITDWFRGSVWIYDNRIAADEDEEQVKLIELIEDVVSQKGVRVILLDNLMTAMDLEPEIGSQDKYDSQSIFIKKLARLALKHDVLIILVAHKRKMGSSEVNDTVAGSADIVNLASIVISYERGSKDDEEGTRRLRVTKNRLFGALTSGKGILLDFDKPSKRIYVHGSNGERKRRYGWEEYDGYVGKQIDVNDLPWA